MYVLEFFPPHKIDSITMVTGFLPSVFEFWNILYLTGSCPLIINYLLAFSFFLQDAESFGAPVQDRGVSDL